MTRDRSSLAPIISLLVAAIGIGVLSAAFMQPIIGAITFGLTPIQQGISGLLSPVSTTVARLLDFGEQREENDRLQRTVELLNSEIVRLRESEIENERLRSMLDFRLRNPKLQVTAARIIALDPSSPVRAATIDRGSDAGFKEGMVAISPAGNLVGRIVQVRPTSSRILFIVDSSSSVNAMVQRADLRALGIINGLPGDRLIMRYLYQQDDVRPGDIVTTSGLGENYPRGVFIGTVAEVKRNEVDLFQEARISPSVKFSRLEAVQVLTNFLPRSLD